MWEAQHEYLRPGGTLSMPRPRSGRPRRKAGRRMRDDATAPRDFRLHSIYVM